MMTKIGRNAGSRHRERICLEDIEKILLTAIAIERYGQEFYHHFSESLADDKGKSLMNGLARDEKEHEEVLSKEFKSHLNRSAPKKIDINLGMKAIRDIFGSKRKITLEKDIILEILQVGIIVEDESIKFYSTKAKATTDSKFTNLLLNLVKIEKEHKSMLEENLFHLKQEGSWWGYVPILEG